MKDAKSDAQIQEKRDKDIAENARQQVVIAPWALCYECEQPKMDHNGRSALACNDFTLHPL
jgi:hypothetical protein